MKRMHAIGALLLTAWMLPDAATSAQTTTVASRTAGTNIELILDASGSMNARLPSGSTRINAAKDVLTNFVSKLPADPQLNVGLRIYGAVAAASAPEACQDTKLVLPMKGLDRVALQNAVVQARPKGATPIALSLQQSAADFPHDQSRKLVILVTDGQESCKGDLAAAKNTFKAAGIAIDLRIIGIDLDKAAQATFAAIGTFENATSSLELAAALGRATAGVADPSQVKLPVTVTVTSGGQPLATGPKVSFTSALDAKSVVAFAPAAGAFGAQLLPGSYTALIETAESGAQTFGGLSVAVGAPNKFTFEVGNVAPVKLDFTPTPPVAGAKMTVTFSGAPAGARNWITIAQKSDPDRAYLDYQYVSRPSGTVELTVPDEEVEHEVRYHLGAPDGSTRVVGRSVAFTPKRIAASLTAPDSAIGGSQVEVRWTGPNNQGDYVTIVKAGAPVGTYNGYAYTSAGNPVKLLLPLEVGAYELRYVSSSTTPNPTRASRPITLTGATYSLDAPAVVPAASTVEVRWTGPNNKGDYITVVKAGAPVGTYTAYANTSAGNPVKIVLTAEPGAYELRYSTEAATPNPTLASRPITVQAATYSITAPATAVAGSTIEIRWTGSKSTLEYLTVVKAGAPAGTFGEYVYTRAGNPAKLLMPATAGNYEVRYMTDEKPNRPTLAKASITITPKA